MLTPSADVTEVAKARGGMAVAERWKEGKQKARDRFSEGSEPSGARPDAVRPARRGSRESTRGEKPWKTASSNRRAEHTWMQSPSPYCCRAHLEFQLHVSSAIPPHSEQLGFSRGAVSLSRKFSVDLPIPVTKIHIMSFAEIIDEVPALTLKERHELSALLAKLEVENDSEYWKDIRRRADDTNPSSWVSLEDLKKGR